MATSRLPQDIKELLTAYIDSVGQLEALLIFFRSPDSVWSAFSLSQEMRSHETIVSQHLNMLHKNEFIEKQNEKEFSFTKNKILQEKAQRLLDAYRDMSVAVIAYIYERPNDKLMGFADAFRIKKD